MGDGVRSHRLIFSPTIVPLPPFRCQFNLSPVLLTHWSAISQKFPWHPSQGQLIFQSTSQKSVKCLLTFTSLIKSMTKDTDEWPDEDIHRAWSARVPGAGAPVSMELRCVTLPVWMCSPTWTLWTLQQWDLMEASLDRQDPFLAPPLWRMTNGDENSKLLIMPRSFWWPAPIQQPPRSPPRVPFIEQGMVLVLLSLRNLQEFRELYARHQGQWPLHIFYYLTAGKWAVCHRKELK